MRKLLALAVCSALAGCSGAQQAIQQAETVYAKVKAYYVGAPRTVFALRGGYDIALGAAVVFKTSMCPAVTSHPYCPTVIPQMRAANHRALVALDDAEAYVRAHPTFDATSLIAAAQQAVTDFAKVETDNGVPAQ